MSRKTTDTTTTNKPEASPTASITPEALQSLFANMAELKATVAKYQAEAEAATKAMEAEKPAKMAIAGKSEQSIKNEIATVRAFKRAGFGTVIPRVDVFTFNLWAAKGFRPKEGSKSVKVGNLRLFCKAQVRQLTPEERKTMQEQSAAAAKRHEKGGTAKVHQLNPQQGSML
jgi:hypothetical protein